MINTTLLDSDNNSIALEVGAWDTSKVPPWPFAPPAVDASLHRAAVRTLQHASKVHQEGPNGYRFQVGRSLDVPPLGTLHGSSWLDDEVINAWISVLRDAAGSDVVVLDSYMFLDRTDEMQAEHVEKVQRRLLPDGATSLLDVPLILAPMHLEGMQHWVAVAIQPHLKQTWVFDGWGDQYGDGDYEIKGYFIRIDKTIKILHDLLGKKYKGWPRRLHDSPAQTDDYSCGVLTCLALSTFLLLHNAGQFGSTEFGPEGADQILWEATFPRTNPRSLQQWRKTILFEILRGKLAPRPETLPIEA